MRERLKLNPDEVLEIQIHKKPVFTYFITFFYKSCYVIAWDRSSLGMHMGSCFGLLLSSFWPSLAKLSLWGLNPCVTSVSRPLCCCVPALVLQSLLYQFAFPALWFLLLFLVCILLGEILLAWRKKGSQLSPGLLLVSHQSCAAESSYCRQHLVERQQLLASGGLSGCSVSVRHIQSQHHQELDKIKGK